MTTIKVGDITVVPLLDGIGHECAREVLRRHGRADEWNRHPGETDQNGDLSLALGGYLIRTKDRVILIDAGVGTIDNGRYRGGQFLQDLHAQGLHPEDVTDVAFTHLHFDHVGWATQRGQVVFHNATHHVHQDDWEHFVEADDSDPGAVRKLQPLESRVTTFAATTSIAPGVDARPAAGHTPGTSVYVISDGGDRLVLAGDLAHHPLELIEDGWSFLHDQDAEQARTARRRLIEEFADTPARIAAGHFPKLAPGRLVTVDGHLTWTTN